MAQRGCYHRVYKKSHPYPRRTLSRKTLLSGSACARRSDSEENKSPPLFGTEFSAQVAVINKHTAERSDLLGPVFHAQRKAQFPPQAGTIMEAFQS